MSACHITILTYYNNANIIEEREMEFGQNLSTWFFFRQEVYWHTNINSRELFPPKWILSLPTLDRFDFAIIANHHRTFRTFIGTGRQGGISEFESGVGVSKLDHTSWIKKKTNQEDASGPGWQGSLPRTSQNQKPSTSSWKLLLLRLEEYVDRKLLVMKKSKESTHREAADYRHSWGSIVEYADKGHLMNILSNKKMWDN